MDTRFKNTNFFVKFICILLSLLTMMGAFFCAFRVAETAMYFRGSGSIIEAMTNDNKTLADCYILNDKITDDMYYLYEETTADDLSVKFANEKDDFMTAAMEAFSVQKAAYQGETTTVAEYADESEYYEEDYSDSDAFQFTYTLSDENNDYPMVLENYIYLSEDESSVYQQLSEFYDMYVSDYILEEYYNSGHILANDLKYYVVNNDNGAELTNISEALDENTFLESHRYALTVVDGVPYYSKEFEGVIDNYLNHETGKLLLQSASHCDFLLYVDESIETDYGYSYALLFKNFNRVKAYNTKQDFIAGIVLAVISLILAIYSFTAAGKRLENGKVKRMWTDYIPTDLHLVVTGWSITALVALMVMLLDEFDADPGYDEFVLMKAAAVGIVGAIWLLFIEFVTSLIRVCRSEKGLWNNLFVVMVVKYVIVKPIAAIIRGIRKAVTYRPNNFKKQIRKFLIGYGLLNLFLLIVEVLAAAADNLALIFVLFIFLIALNTAALIFIIGYVINLDKIITAAHLRTVPQVNYAKLPTSLKMLYNSLQYTRQELDNAVTQAVKDERMRTELITNVSHDLRTPLTSIITYVDLLKQCNVQDENAKEYIEVLDDKGKRLKRLIDDLIEASKITSGVITLNPVMLSLNELAAQAVYERQQEFIDNNLELVFKGDTSNVNCYADGNKTFRILDNLLSNARKYSARGTRIYCDVYETQNFSIFEIKNISAEKLDITPQELTERFVRGDRSRNAEGNGLGLSIADNLCKAQRGKLNITIDGDLFKAQVMLPKHK